MRMLRFLALSSLVWLNTVTARLSAHYDTIASREEGNNQTLVTWDEHSFIIRGERLFLFSGEFHPFRLPVPGLWLDIFQKIKAMGFNGVSFYTYWGLQEGQRGRVVTDGIWDLQPFFDAASEAGIYLIARPGPYINAETAAGGMPGWTLRLNCTLRSNEPECENATKLYLATLGKSIAANQITNGGPVVLVQPENEYSSWPNVNASDFPLDLNRAHMQFVEDQLRDAGIVVPFIDNDNLVKGYFAPGTGEGSVDIYGIDAYPMRYDCANPDIWPTYRFPRDWQIYHQQQSPSTPFAVPEFQGGSGTGWGPGSVNQDGCNALVNEESVRVLFKNNYSFGIKLLNIYMTYGGTNWGNLGYQGGDSSYDYGAAITEDRHVWREKYSEQKLEANFLKVSPAYLTAIPGNASNGSYVSTNAIATTPLFGTENDTNFYIIRHADFTSLDNTPYFFTVHNSAGNLTIPQLGGQLSLNGRDSKIHVTDYDVGGVNMVYCTADIFTWARSAQGKGVLMMYGGAGESHEFAFPASLGRPVVMDENTVIIAKRSGLWIIQWTVAPARQVVHLPHVGLNIHMLWRNDAYSHWVLELPGPAPIGNYTLPSKQSVIVKGGYLMRTAEIDGTELKLTGDINATTDFELIYEPTGKVNSWSFNGRSLQKSDHQYRWFGHGSSKLTATMIYEPPSIDLPDFSSIQWRYIDSLPELQRDYDDMLWTSCDHNTTTNPLSALETPTSLYASDYGYHTGSLLYRGHFVANGDETSLFLNISGGSAFAYSVWLNQTFLGSWLGNSGNQTYASTFDLPSNLSTGGAYVLTVLIDHMGQDEEAPGTDAIKFPRGLLTYTLFSRQQRDVTWKMTGNLGGEQYRDQIRGPRNEGAMFAERQGYHLPAPPTDKWKVASPILDGLQDAGVGFFSTSFELHVPEAYDVPMSFVFANTTAAVYRVQLFVNGYQFGKYIPNLGPQTAYPVPEGILNYNGTNWVALTLWSLESEGAKLGGLELVPQMPVLSGYARPALAPQTAWQAREGAY